MEITSLGARTDVLLRRLGGSVITEADTHLVVRTPANPTFYWGNFLLFAVPPQPGDAPRWVEVFRREFPDADHVAIAVDGTDGDLGAEDEMRAHGLIEDVGVVLTAEHLTPIPVRGDGEVRLLRSDEEWQQAAEMSVAGDEDQSPEHRAFTQRRLGELRRLVEDGRGVYVGTVVDGVVRAGLGLFAVGGLARYQSVQTHPEFRRRGFAGAMLVEADRLVRARHPIERLVIAADPSYVAIDLYRRLGFRDAERQVQWLRRPG